MNKNIKVAEVADIIINGYAFTKDGGTMRITCRMCDESRAYGIIF